MRTPRPRIKSRQTGQANIFLVPFIFAAVLFVGAAGFGLWAFTERQDYRNNVQQKIAAAVKDAEREEGIRKDKEHAEADKQPLKAYNGPAQFGALKVMYPKTWSGYVDELSNDPPVNGYFHPGVVPSVSNPKAGFALRVKVSNEPYDQALSQFDNVVEDGTVKSQPYAFPQRPNIVGVRMDGTFEHEAKFTGTVIIIPLRDKTLEVWSETPTYAADFANNILPNLTFNP